MAATIIITRAMADSANHPAHRPIPRSLANWDRISSPATFRRQQAYSSLSRTSSNSRSHNFFDYIGAPTGASGANFSVSA